MLKKMLTLMLFLLLPMNFGFVENSSVDCSFEQSSDLSFYAEHYETSDLMMSEFDATLTYTNVDNVEHIITTSPTRSVITTNNYHNYSKPIFVTSPGDDSKYYFDDPTMLTGYSTFQQSYIDLPPGTKWDYGNSNNSANVNPYENKGGGIFPFYSRYMILNSKVNRQVPRLYTSGFI